MIMLKWRELKLSMLMAMTQVQEEVIEMVMQIFFFFSETLGIIWKTHEKLLKKEDVGSVT